jgi:hypothetical protein
MSTIKEKITNALTSVSNAEDQAIENGLAAVHAADALVVKIHQKVEQQSAQHRALEKTLPAASLVAETSGDTASYDKVVAAIAASAAGLARTESALIAAQEQVLVANQTLFKIKSADHVRHTQRLCTARMKRVTELAEHIEGLAVAYRHVLAANAKIVGSWRTGIAPPDAGLFPRALVDLISRELMRVHPVNPITINQHPPLPGAFSNAYAGDPTKWKSLIDETQIQNDYLIGLTERGPK